MAFTDNKTKPRAFLYTKLKRNLTILIDLTNRNSLPGAKKNHQSGFILIELSRLYKNVIKLKLTKLNHYID